MCAVFRGAENYSRIRFAVAGLTGMDQEAWDRLGETELGVKVLARFIVRQCG